MSTGDLSCFHCPDLPHHDCLPTGVGGLDCVREARAQLARIAVLFDESTVSLSAAKGRRTGERVTRSRARDASVDFAILQTRTEITELLDSWAALVVDERAVHLPGSRDVAGLTRFLANHVEWLAEHPAARDFIEEIAGLIGRALAAIDIDHLAVVPRGCAVPGCPGNLTVADGDISSEWTLRCEFGHEWGVGEWLMLTDRPAAGRLSDDRPRTVPTKAAAIALQVSEATIRQWVHRGKLTRYGPACRAEFDIQELAALVATTARKRSG